MRRIHGKKKETDAAIDLFRCVVDDEDFSSFFDVVSQRLNFQNRSRRGTIDFVLFVFVRAVVVAVAVDLVAVAVVVLRSLLARPPLLRRRSKYHQGRPL